MRDQRAAVAFGVQHGRRGNANGGLAAARFAIDDRGAFAAVGQQLGDGMHHLGLRAEQLALETGQHELAMRPGLAGVDGRVGAVERVQQFVAEFGNEILKAHRQGRSSRFEQVALDGSAIGGGNNVGIEGHGDAP